jgi:hypothetical protein
MNKKVENLINKCSVIEPLEGRVLVHPLKLRTYESTTQEPDYEKAKAEGRNPMEDEMPMKQKIYDVNYAYQRAIVLQVAKNEPRLKIGNTIIYKVSNLLAFDLIPNVSMLKNFEVIAIERQQSLETGYVL